MQSFKYIFASVLIMGILAFLSDILFASKKTAHLEASVYDFKMISLEGEEIDFERYRGKYLLIVNTASKCGYTPQYADLQKLQDLYRDKLNVLGFPANDFLWQEPGSDEEIASFCEKNYGVNFQMFSKISVKGRDQHPLYTWLEKKSGKAPAWNFCKYLIDGDGNVIGFYHSKITPLNSRIVDKIK